jgi:DNA polymerase-3 subunit alpha
MKKCNIISVKKIGREKTYNVTMGGDQHNYKIVDKDGRGIYSKNSHSCAYAFIGYQTGWLKRYYPIEFMCNLLSSEIQNNDKDEKLNGYRRAVARMGIKIDPIDINKSGIDFKIETGHDDLQNKNVDYLREPLSCAEGAGTKAVENIVKNQPYENLSDFIRKVDARIVNIRVFTSLVKGKCFDSICGANHNSIMKAYAEAKEKLDKEKKELQRQQKRAAKEGKGSIFDEAKPEECNNSESESMDIEVTGEFDPSNKNIDF